MSIESKHKSTEGKGLFFRYVIPSVLSYALSGVYAIADGFFVGNSVGDVGLSAINVVYPVVTLIQAVGTGLGMGGAVMWTVKHAEGKKEEGDAFLKNAVFFLLLSSLLLMSVLFLFLNPILGFLGAEGNIGTLGKQYLEIIIAGAFFQTFATGIVPFIRNHGGASYAMGTMVAGFFTNIFLDYLFVWVLKWGMPGAAAATILGQAVTMFGSVFYLWKHRMLKGGFALSGAGMRLQKIVKIGIAPFGLTLSPMISLLLMNRFCVRYGGEPAVACYACISYAVSVIYLLLQGIGDGSQPLISRYYGEGKDKAVRETRKLSFVSAEILALVCIGVMYWLRGGLGAVFGSSKSVSADVVKALPVFLAGLVFYAFSRISTSYFYATEQSIFSYFCVYAEPACLLLLLLILPVFAGQTGVWWSMVLSQVMTCGIAFFLLQLQERKKRKKRPSSA